jgi:hypothetical protein
MEATVTEKQKAVIERARNTPARFLTIERSKRVTRETAQANHIAKYGEIQGWGTLPDGPPITSTRLVEMAKERGTWGHLKERE